MPKFTEKEYNRESKVVDWASFAYGACPVMEPL